MSHLSENASVDISRFRIDGYIGNVTPFLFRSFAFSLFFKLQVGLSPRTKCVRNSKFGTPKKAVIDQLKPGVHRLKLYELRQINCSILDESAACQLWNNYLCKTRLDTTLTNVLSCMFIWSLVCFSWKL